MFCAFSCAASLEQQGDLLLPIAFARGTVAGTCGNAGGAILGDVNAAFESAWCQFRVVC
jgi:hypothetical protein